MLTKVRNDGDDDDTFWRKLVLPEEERQRLFPEVVWKGGYRWFRSVGQVAALRSGISQPLSAHYDLANRSISRETGS
jgi:hypothetical protein